MAAEHGDRSHHGPRGPRDPRVPRAPQPLFAGDQFMAAFRQGQPSSTNTSEPQKKEDHLKPALFAPPQNVQTSRPPSAKPARDIGNLPPQPDVTATMFNGDSKAKLRSKAIETDTPDTSFRIAKKAVVRRADAPKPITSDATNQSSLGQTPAGMDRSTEPPSGYTNREVHGKENTPASYQAIEAQSTPRTVVQTTPARSNSQRAPETPATAPNVRPHAARDVPFSQPSAASAPRVPQPSASAERQRGQNASQIKSKNTRQDDPELRFVRMRNIAVAVKAEDIYQFFCSFRIARNGVTIHRENFRTAYVEFLSHEDAKEAKEALDRKPLCALKVTLDLVSKPPISVSDDHPTEVAPAGIRNHALAATRNINVGSQNSQGARGSIIGQERISVAEPTRARRPTLTFGLEASRYAAEVEDTQDHRLRVGLHDHFFHDTSSYTFARDARH
ncbi:hypothetical protein BDY21DRAFT_40252 [Lineolata rhizophorae]|uniref:RRM domain-containing protein n=1 Tax=Lineolata rhizophorae TaxID=578093 RepID=A0A6A6NY59_9PEZI|nr:hypothetical protein BDY21DRAFT_40252 [Lineolata rhizophorae]